MSLTLARLCDEWQLFSRKYKARIAIFRILATDYFIPDYHDFSRKYKARIAIFCILATNYFYHGILQFWLKYKARIAIFCIIATIDRFSWISQKVESR